MKTFTGKFPFPKMSEKGVTYKHFLMYLTPSALCSPLREARNGTPFVLRDCKCVKMRRMELSLVANNEILILAKYIQKLMPCCKKRGRPTSKDIDADDPNGTHCLM